MSKNVYDEKTEIKKEPFWNKGPNKSQLVEKKTWKKVNEEW